MIKDATPETIFKALDPDVKRYEYRLFPPYVEVSPPVRIPLLVPEVCFMWAAASTAWTLWEGFSWSAVLTPGLIIGSLLALVACGAGMTFHKISDAFKALSVPIWRENKTYRIGFTFSKEVCNAYANEAYRDLARTYVMNMMAIKEDSLLDYQQRAELEEECHDNFKDAVDRRAEERRESMALYVQTWKDRVNNFG